MATKKIATIVSEARSAERIRHGEFYVNLEEVKGWLMMIKRNSNLHLITNIK